MKKCVNLRLSLFLAISLIVGIIFFVNLYLHQVIISTLIAVGYISLLCFYLFYNLKGDNLLKKACVLLSLICLFFIGVVNVKSNIDNYENANLNNHYYTVNGSVYDMLQRDDGIYLVLSKVSVKGNVSKKLDYKVAVYISGNQYENIDLGTNVQFYALLQDMGVVYEDALSVYNMQLKVKHVAFVNDKDVKVLSQTPTLFQKANVFLRESLKRGLDEEEFAVAYALITGHDEFIENQTLTQFRNAGIAHIFAVSGLHIGFLSAICSFILKKIRCNKWVRFFITTTTLVFYSGVCGFSASSIRATIMCAVRILVGNFGLRYDGLSSLSISAIIILLLAPIEVFCVGFQLSFVVVLGLLVLSNPLKRLLCKFLPNRLASALAPVLSAQLFSIPICLMSFSHFSLTAVLFNLLFLPLVGVIYTVTFLGCIIGGLFSIPYITLFLTNYALKGIIYLIKLFDFSIFIVGDFSFGGAAILYYLIALIACGFFRAKVKFKVITSIILAIICVVCSVYTNHYKHNQVKTIIVGDESFCASLIICENENTLVINHCERAISFYNIKRLVQRENITKIDNLVIAKVQANVDVHQIATKMNYLFKFDNVFYYGDIQEESENAITTTFGRNIFIDNFYDNQNLPTKNIECNFNQNGYAVECKVMGKEVLFLSRFGSNPNFDKLGDNYHLVVANDYAENIFAKILADRKVCYFFHPKYASALTNGNITHVFK